jgi:hypothetical protein
MAVRAFIFHAFPTAPSLGPDSAVGDGCNRFSSSGIMFAPSNLESNTQPTNSLPHRGIDLICVTCGEIDDDGG